MRSPFGRSAKESQFMQCEELTILSDSALYAWMSLASRALVFFSAAAADSDQAMFARICGRRSPCICLAITAILLRTHSSETALCQCEDGIEKGLTRRHYPRNPVSRRALQGRRHLETPQRCDSSVATFPVWKRYSTRAVGPKGIKRVGGKLR